METAHQAANKALSSASSLPSTKEGEAKASRMNPSLLDDLWLRMAAMFGHTWVNQYGVAPHGIGGDTWAAVLADLRAGQIGIGLQAAVAQGSAWPPSAPQFRAMCMGIPDFAVIRRELAATGSQRSPFAQLVWQNLDACRYKNAATDQADRLLREAYESASQHVMRGGALPEPMTELPAPIVDENAKAWETLRDYAAGWGIELNQDSAEPRSGRHAVPRN